MLAMLARLGLFALGAFLLVANSMGDGDTVLGLYPPTSPGRIGFDSAKLAMSALCVWAVYRAVRPNRRPDSAQQSPSLESTSASAGTSVVVGASWMLLAVVALALVAIAVLGWRVYHSPTVVPEQARTKEPIATESPSAAPDGARPQGLDGVLLCTLQQPALSGNPVIDGYNREDYDKRRDRIVRLAFRDDGRVAELSTPLAPNSVPYDIVFVANRNRFSLFIEENTISSSVYAVSPGVPEAGMLGEMVHMSAASGGFARTYECLRS